MSKPNIREIAEKELRFHEALAAECEQAGTEFARGRACGITELVSDIRKVLAADWLRLTASRCEVYLGGYQPVPIRCALNIHAGQHAGIGDDGATVIWPEQGELQEIDRLKKKVAHLNKLFDMWAISLGICAESRGQLKHENRTLAEQLRTSETAREVL